MEPWTEVRRRVQTGALSKHAARWKYGFNLQPLEKLFSHVDPLEYRRLARREQRVQGPHLAWFYEVLEQDKQDPKKQPHTVERIFDRLGMERRFTGGYAAVKDAVHKRKATMKQVSVPLPHPPGEAQVDFGSAYVDVASGRAQRNAGGAVPCRPGANVAGPGRHEGRAPGRGANRLAFELLRSARPGG